LELEEDEEVKDGYDFFQDLIKKLQKIAIAINQNVQIEEKKKIKGIKPNWDKIQELRNIEKEMKEFQPWIAPKIMKLWKSQELRKYYLYEFGLHSARNLFYYIDNLKKFVLQKQRASETMNNTMDDHYKSDEDNSIPNNLKLKMVQSQTNIKIDKNDKKTVSKWEWEWSFEEILRCQIRTTGVIEQTFTLNPISLDDKHKNFNLKLRIWDVGGAQNERKKWKYVLNENKLEVDCVVFVVNLMSYYKKSWESDKNGLLQSLQLFTCLLSKENNIEHDDKYHKISEIIKNEKDEKNGNEENEYLDPMAFARSISMEEYNVCIDNQVKRAMDGISLFYIIFTDIQGMQQMLNEGISLKTCFKDYDGDDSILDVQNFIQQKFENVINESNKRNISAPNPNLNKNEQQQTPYLMRTGSYSDTKDDHDFKPPLNRIKTVPPSMRTRTDKEEKNNLNEQEPIIEGQKRLKCRFVSVIDHNEMKDVMLEIVQSSFLNKNALDPVIHSLVGQH